MVGHAVERADQLADLIVRSGKEACAPVPPRHLGSNLCQAAYRTGDPLGDKNREQAREDNGDQPAQDHGGAQRRNSCIYI